ncbi:MAG: hypothetical protein DYH06_09100, partial [Acidobacteria bacterium ACB2]|nr:hypothetical protein [Acidobacteria bacterium ACB2]
MTRGPADDAEVEEARPGSGQSDPVATLVRGAANGLVLALCLAGAFWAGPAVPDPVRAALGAALVAAIASASWRL